MEQESVITTVRAIPKEECKSCQMPLDTFLREARVYVQKGTQDQDKLSSAGLPSEYIERAKIVCDLLTQSQTEYLAGTSSKESTQKLWNIKYERAKFVCSEIEDTVEFACRNDELMLNKLRQVREGDTIEDTISDLRVLHQLCTADLTPFQAVGFDLALFDEALALANELTELRMALDNTLYETSEAKLYRDQCLTQLILDTNEICATARYVFRHDKEKKMMYQSKYLRERRSARRREQNTSEQ